MKTPTLLFVSGTARSGTTLLSLVLSAHPDICICPETNHIILALQSMDENGKIKGNKLHNLKKATQNDSKLLNLKIDIASIILKNTIVAHQKMLKGVQQCLSFIKCFLSLIKIIKFFYILKI